MSNNYDYTVYCQEVQWYSNAVLVFCQAERYFCRTRGRNRGESSSAVVSATSAGKKGQNLLKPDKIIVINYIICCLQPTSSILFVCYGKHMNYMNICILHN